MIADDEGVICEILDEDGTACGREFSDDLAWQEHLEDDHWDLEEPP